MTQSLRFALAAVAIALVAACGKMGPPEKPPGATWPKGYPTGAIARLIPGLPNSGTDLTEQQQQQQQPIAADKTAAFTKKGAWIDPDMTRPAINATADQDKYHLNDAVGY